VVGGTVEVVAATQRLIRWAYGTQMLALAEYDRDQVWSGDPKRSKDPAGIRAKHYGGDPLVAQPDGDPPRWQFSRQGNGLNPSTLAPSQARLPGRRPFHRLIRCPACWRTVASTANGRFAALRNAALDA